MFFFYRVCHLGFYLALVVIGIDQIEVTKRQDVGSYQPDSSICGSRDDIQIIESSTEAFHKP